MKDKFKGLILRQPAIRWQDALPCGNGTIGALVYGNICNELVLLNHEDLWLKTQKPQINTVNQYLDEYRALLFNGKYSQAADFFTGKLKEANPDIVVDPYQPAFDLGFDTEIKAAYTSYRRTLNFETGEAVVSWLEDKIAYSRRLFVSRIHDAVVLNIKAEGESTGINCRVSLFAHDSKETVSMGSGKYNDKKAIPFTYEIQVKGNSLVFKARYEDGREFGGLAKVVAIKGELLSGAEFIELKGAHEVTVLLKLFVEESYETAVERLDRELESMPSEYNALIAAHSSVHGELFRRMRFDLQSGNEFPSSNEELLMECNDGGMPEELAVRMFDYGRYLLISSSRQGGLPANLQGIWNGDYTPAWWSDFHNDENIQMNYWQALPGNLPETVLPYFDYYESMMDDFRNNARAIYGCRGILVPVCQTTHGLVWPDIWAGWTAGAGWLAQLFYDYWLYTGDRDFLKNRTIPFLKEVALFYEDFLIEMENGTLVFAPSLSPENIPLTDNASFVAINATMDIAVAREVLKNLFNACVLLDVEQDKVPKWKSMISKLPEYEINADGALKEWLWTGLGDNYHHRHLSHVYPLFPGIEISEESDPLIYEAIRTAVEKRHVIGLTSQSGWSLAHMANIYARLCDGEKAKECLKLLCRSCVGPNLFTYHNDWRSQGITMFWGFGNHPPFQIDANFGFTAAILEMLVFSAPGMLKLLPALPVGWKRGVAEGILCRGCIKVSLTWDLDERRFEFTINSTYAQRVTVKFPFEPAELECSEKEGLFDSELSSNYKVLYLPACKEVFIKLGT